MNPDEELSQTLKDHYRLRFGEGGAYRDGVWQVLCRHFFQRYVAPDAHLLDLGCGWGEFSNNIQAGKQYAMDLNPDTAQYLKPGVELLAQDCSEPWPLADASLDVIFTSNFLEHLPDKAAVERTLAEARRCLRPGGRFILLGPNVRLVPGAYWDFWDHHVAISDHSLGEVLNLKGFQVTESHARFLPYTMSDGRQPNLALVRLYLHIPLASRSVP